MNKKTKQIIGALIALIIVVSGIVYMQKANEQQGSKEITIQIIVEDQEIFNETINTDVTTLADLLKEMKDNQKIQLEYENSAWGMYIQGLGTHQLYMEDPNKGMYWTYNSENNASCVENNFCDAANLLNIGDGDIFVFTLEAYE